MGASAVSGVSGSTSTSSSSHATSGDGSTQTTTQPKFGGSLGGDSIVLPGGRKVTVNAAGSGSGATAGSGSGASGDLAGASRRLLAQSDPDAKASPDAFVSGTAPTGAYSVGVTGGTAAASAAAVKLDPSLAPQVANPTLLSTSLQYAQRLTTGSSASDLLGASPTDDQKKALGDAYEILGISNRQIQQLANDAGKGGIDTLSLSPTSDLGNAAIAALGPALRARGAVDPNGAKELDAHNTLIALGDIVPSSSTPTDPFSVDGAVQAVEAGTRQSGAFFSPTAAARDMLFGGGSVHPDQQAFTDKGFFTSDYSGSVQDGAATLKQTQIDAQLPPGQVQANAVSVLGSANPIGSSDDALRNVGAGFELQQILGADVAKNLEGQSGGSYDQSSAVQAALTQHGISLTPGQISGKLYDAITSPQFAQYVSAQPADQQAQIKSEALGTLGFFDADAEASAAASNDLGEATGGALTGRQLLNQLGSTTPDQALAQATPTEKGTSLSGYVAEVLSGLRFANGGIAANARAVSGAEATQVASGLARIWNDPAFKADPSGFLADQADLARRINQDQLPNNLAFEGTATPVTSAQAAEVQQTATFLLGHGVDAKTDLFASALNPVLALGSLAAHAANANNGDTGDKIENGVKIVADALTVAGGTKDIIAKTAPSWSGLHQSLQSSAISSLLQNLVGEGTGTWAGAIANSLTSNGAGLGNALSGAAGVSNSIRSYTDGNLDAFEKTANGAQLVGSLANLHNGVLSLGLASYYRAAGWSPERAQTVFSAVGLAATAVQFGFNLAG